MVEDGRIEFQFSSCLHIFLNYSKTSIHVEIRELSMIKSKYTMIMLKLIRPKRFGDRNTINIKRYGRSSREWFLGKEKRRKVDIQHDSLNKSIKMWLSKKVESKYR